jgi:hypothetical protein
MTGEFAGSTPRKYLTHKAPELRAPGGTDQDTGVPSARSARGLPRAQIMKFSTLFHRPYDGHC